MALVWSSIAQFVNEKKTGSVTLHFDRGVMKLAEEKVTRRF